MGRRGSFRGRPGFLTIILFTVSLTIFYLSWKLLITPYVKEVDSAQKQGLVDYSNKLTEIKKTNEQIDSKSYRQEQDYTLGNALFTRKHAAPVFQQYEAADDKEPSNKSLVSKEPIPTAEKSESKISQSDMEALQTDKSIVRTVRSMKKYVHLDLKGAPPKMSYLQLFIRLIKRLGATGLLVEYEDMFPYTGILEHIRANNAYSIEDIKEFLKFVEKAQLTVMPLIPTFGHMEFVLKSEFSNLRESDYTPQVIDITQGDSYVLIAEMIKQILKAHPGATHLHIGCDEVYELENGISAIEMQQKNISARRMFLKHVVRVANLVREQAGGVMPVIWDDELRQIHSTDLENSGLASLVDIMVRQYSTNILHAIDNAVWNKYANVFKSVWIASSFKGSTGARQIVTEPEHHLNNHLSWLEVITAYSGQVTFKGIVLTGWQRYDHFSTLCELLPAAIPSLAVCLATMVNGGFTQDIHVSTSKLIDCKHPIEMNLPVPQKPVAYDCMFPGYEVYYAVQELYKITVHDSDTRNLLEGWLSDYQVAHAFSNPGQLKVLTRSLVKQISLYNLISNFLRGHLAVIYTEDTVDEWIEENIQERMRHIRLLQGKIESLQQLSSWPKRPLLPVVGMRELISTNYIDNANRENKNNQERQFESVSQVAQNQSVQSANLNTKSSQKYTDDTVAPVSQNQGAQSANLNKSSQKYTYDTVAPVSQNQSAQSTNLNTKSSQKYIDDTVAPVSHNQQNQFQEKSLNMGLDQKETLVSYKTPLKSNDFEKADKDISTSNMFTDSTIEQTHLRSNDKEVEILFDNGVTTDSNTLL